MTPDFPIGIGIIEFIAPTCAVFQSNRDATNNYSKAISIAQYISGSRSMVILLLDIWNEINRYTVLLYPRNLARLLILSA